MNNAKTWTVTMELGHMYDVQAISEKQAKQKATALHRGQWPKSKAKVKQIISWD